MRRTELLFILVCGVELLCAQNMIVDTIDDDIIYIKTSSYEAVIFDTTIPHFNLTFPENTPSEKKEYYKKRNDFSKTRWNPTVADVEKADSLIMEFLVQQKKVVDKTYNRRIKHRKLNKNSFICMPKRWGDYDDRIIQHIDQYVRQYRGIKDKRGNRILYVNFISKDELIWHPGWEKKWITTCDGGYLYWQVKVNLRKKRCFDMRINGDG